MSSATAETDAKVQMDPVSTISDLMTNYMKVVNGALDGTVTEGIARTAIRGLDGVRGCAGLLLQHRRLNRGRQPEKDLLLISEKGD